MGQYRTTVRLTEKGADVISGPAKFTVSRRDRPGGHGCPMEYMAGALGS